MAILKEEGKNSKSKTRFKKLETFTENLLGGYTVTNLSCLHDDYEAWTFDVFFDLIIGMNTAKEDNNKTSKEFNFEDYGSKKKT